MADHWNTPEARGIYGHPASHPPIPQHRSSNDIGARVARIEEHQQFSAHDMRRIEQESMRRAADIVAWMSSQIGSLGHRVTTLENSELTQTARRQAIWDLFKTTGNGVALVVGFLKWSSVAAVAYLLITGKITVEAAKVLLGAVGSLIGS